MGNKKIPDELYDDKETAVKSCSKFDICVKVTCHQCSGVADIDL